MEPPAAVGERVWIHGLLTDIDAATIQTPEPEPAPPAGQAPVLPDGCTRLHTVNPNETQLSQITD